MIRKPETTEKESRAHAAVGRGLDAGAQGLEAADRGFRLMSRGCLLYLAVGSAIALVVSSTPIWFKAVVLAIGYGIYRLVRRFA